MYDGSGGETFSQPFYLPTKESETTSGRSIRGFLICFVTSAMGMLVLPHASMLGIVLAILAFGMFVYALKHSAAV